MITFFWGIKVSCWEKWCEFKYQWRKITVSAIISPLLYLLALGLGLGGMISSGEGAYINFLIPGLIAMNTMNTSYSAISMDLTVQRLHEMAFEQVIISPTPLYSYIVGQIIAGALRGMYVGVIIILLSIPFGVHLHITFLFLLIMFLNGLVFAALGVLAAILAKTHADIARFSTFVITPMMFLCNTIFPIDRAPIVISEIVKFLPLTQASYSLRSIALYNSFNPLVFILLPLYAVGIVVITNIILVKKSNI